MSEKMPAKHAASNVLIWTSCNQISFDWTFCGHTFTCCFSLKNGTGLQGHSKKDLLQYNIYSFSMNTLSRLSHRLAVHLLLGCRLTGPGGQAKQQVPQLQDGHEGEAQEQTDVPSQLQQFRDCDRFYLKTPYYYGSFQSAHC